MVIQKEKSSSDGKLSEPLSRRVWGQRPGQSKERRKFKSEEIIFVFKKINDKKDFYILQRIFT